VSGVESLVGRALAAYKASLDSGETAALLSLLEKELLPAGEGARARLRSLLEAERARLVKLRTLGLREGLARMEAVTAAALGALDRPQVPADGSPRRAPSREARRRGR
jgi:hypothetical protein